MGCWLAVAGCPPAARTNFRNILETRTPQKEPMEAPGPKTYKTLPVTFLFASRKWGIKNRRT
jgi:hypothetical protein